MDIPFETEADLCVRGNARTPDVPLGLRVRKRNQDNNALSRITMQNLFHTTNYDKGEGAIQED
jgi:hypothetical protein